MVLIYVSLMISGVEHFFYISISHLYVFFGKTSIQVFHPFLNWIICFLLSFMSSLYILYINLL